MNKKYLELKEKLKSIGKSIYKRNLLLIAVCSSLMLLNGCQSDTKASSNTKTDNNQVIDNKTGENDSNVSSTPTESNVEEAKVVKENGNDEESTLSFSELSKYQFVFSSGVGAWQTILYINSDGTFTGFYSDSDMGNTGEDYPNGVNYASNFEGKFTKPKKINDYTYSMEIESIKLLQEVGSEEIIDGIKYIYSEPYGLNDAKEIYIYTPQALLKDLPEGFRNWVGYVDLSNVEVENLPFYGLYNVETESGFSSYELITD